MKYCTKRLNLCFRLEQAMNYVIILNKKIIIFLFLEVPSFILSNWLDFAFIASPYNISFSKIDPVVYMYMFSFLC